MLKQITVTVLDRELTLSQANLEMEIRHDTAITDLRGEPAQDPVRQYVCEVYANLTAAIVTGEAPSLDAFLSIPAIDLNDWAEAVRELNPHWFPEIVIPEMLEKKEN